MYEVFAKLLEQNHVTATEVSKATGIRTSTLTDWKHGRTNPKADKLRKIADYFGVSLEYLMTGEEPDGFYLNAETAQIAQEMFEDPDMRTLYDLKEKIGTERFRAHIDLMRKLYEQENPDA